MFTLHFETDNATFDEVDSIECSMRLQEIAEKMKEGYRKGKIYDTNGNRIGGWQVTE